MSYKILELPYSKDNLEQNGVDLDYYLKLYSPEMTIRTNAFIKSQWYNSLEELINDWFKISYKNETIKTNDWYQITLTPYLEKIIYFEND